MVRLIFVSAMLCTSTLVFSSPVYYDGLPRDSTGPRAMAMGDRYSASSETYTCDAKNFTYIEMAGYGTLPAAFVDKFGDTLSTGSGTAVTDWKTPDRGKSYTATVWALPDRGW